MQTPSTQPVQNATGGRAKVLIREGLCHLEVRQKVSRPALLLEHSSSTPAYEWSVVHMLDFLIRDGWKHALVPRKCKSSELLGEFQMGYRAGGQKIWFSRSSQSTVCREYLLCLITATDLFNRGADHIIHQEQKAYYVALLRDPATAETHRSQVPLFGGKLVESLSGALCGSAAHEEEAIPAPALALTQVASRRVKRPTLQQTGRRMLARGRGAQRQRTTHDAAQDEPGQPAPPTPVPEDAAAAPSSSSPSPAS